MPVVLLVFICVLMQLRAEPLKVSVKSEAAILMNGETGAVLYEKNSKKLYSPASTTKVATALYALKIKGDKLNEILTAEPEDLATVAEEEKRRVNYTMPAYWLVKDGTHIGLKKGESMSFLDLLYGMMLESGNDASNVIARYVGGTIPDFMTGLNAYLKEIRCLNTTFYNPHGLFYPKHQSTAYDMALMTKEALQYPIFCKIISTLRYPRPLTNKQQVPVTFMQHNKLLKKGPYHYPKAIGVKTGYHSKALHTLIAAAKDDQRTLIAVILKAKEKGYVYNDAITLFEAAFNQTKINHVLLAAGPQKFQLELEGGQEPVKTYLKEDLMLSYYPAEEPSYKSYLHWNTIIPPIAKDQEVGAIHVIQPETGVILTAAPLFAQDEVHETWRTWLGREATPGYILALCAIIALVIFLIRKLVKA